MSHSRMTDITKNNRSRYESYEGQITNKLIFDEDGNCLNPSFQKMKGDRHGWRDSHGLTIWPWVDKWLYSWVNKSYNDAYSVFCNEFKKDKYFDDIKQWFKTQIVKDIKKIDGKYYHNSCHYSYSLVDLNGRELKDKELFIDENGIIRIYRRVKEEDLYEFKNHRIYKVIRTDRKTLSYSHYERPIYLFLYQWKGIWYKIDVISVYGFESNIYKDNYQYRNPYIDHEYVEIPKLNGHQFYIRTWCSKWVTLSKQELKQYKLSNNMDWAEPKLKEK